MGEHEVIRVTVRRNLVCAIERVARPPGVEVPATRLAVTAELARNHRARGCLDGEYLFTDPERAKSFAVLCLDFVARLARHTAEGLEARDFASDADWRA